MDMPGISTYDGCAMPDCLVQAGAGVRPASRRGIPMLLVAALLAGAVLRLAHLHAFPPVTDESNYARWAVDIWREHTRHGLLIPVLDDGKQPLLFWVQAALYGLGLPALLAGRLLAAGSGVLAIALTYALGRRLYSPHVGLAAAWLYAVAPWAVLHERLGLVDGPLTVAVLATAYASRRAVDGNAGRWGTLAAVAGLCATGIKASGVVAAALPLLSAALYLLPPGQKRVRGMRFASLCMPAALVLGLYLWMLYGPLGPRFRYMVGEHSVGLSRPAELMATWAENAVLLGSYVPAYFPLSWPLLPVVLLAPLRTRRRADWYVLGCCAVTVLPVLLFGRRIYSRYFLIGLPFIAILLAVFLETLVRALPGSVAAWRIRLVGILAVGFCRVRTMPVYVLATMLVAAPQARASLLLVMQPERAPLAAQDRDQYISGPGAGWGLPEALNALERDAAGRPAFALTNPGNGIPRDYTYLRFLDHPTIRHYVDFDVWQAVRPRLEQRWSSHRVPLYLVINAGREDPAAIERSWPDATIVARVEKPGGQSAIIVYRLPGPS